MELSFREKRLVLETTGGPTGAEAQPVTPANPAFEKFKTEGFRNLNGTSYDPVNHAYFDGKNSTSMTPEKAFDFRQPNAKPFKEAEKAAAEVAKGTVEAKTVTGEALAKLKTVKDLGGLREAMGDDYKSIVSLVEAKVTELKFQDTFSLNSNFASDQTFEAAGGKLKNALGESLKKALSSKENEGIAKKIEGLFSGNKEDVAALLAEFYSIDAVKSMKGCYESKRLAMFIKDPANAASTYAMKYEVGFDRGKLVTNITSDAAFDTAFKDFNDKNLVLTPEKAAEKAAKEEVDGKRLERAKKFRSTFAGKFLSMAGIVSLEEPPVDSNGRLVAESDDAKRAREERNNNAYADVLKGDNFIAKWFIFIFGGGAMIDGGTADIEASIAGLDPKFKPMVDKFQLMAKKSPLNLEKTAAELASPIKAPEAQPVNSEDFPKLIGSKEAVKTPFKLAGKFNTGDNGLRIVLGDGAKIVLPKGAKLRNAETDKFEPAEEKDPNVIDKTIRIKYEIPDGVLFSGSVKFEQVAQDKKPDVAPDNKDKMGA